MTYLERYTFWCNAGLPTDVQAELASLEGNEEELKGRFGGDLQFALPVCAESWVRAAIV